MSENIVLSAFAFFAVISTLFDVNRIALLYSCWLSSNIQQKHKVDRQIFRNI